jgi:hypothetical protein
MRKTILIVVILSCFLLLVTPCINAVENKEVKESIKKSIILNFNELDNQVKHKLYTFTNNIIGVLLILLFVFEIGILISVISAVLTYGYGYSFIVKLILIFLGWISVNLFMIYYMMEDVMNAFDLDWLPFYNIVKFILIIIEFIFINGYV